ncbi:MAG: hypothetical protein ACUVS5_01295 [Anaerolineae bacterium]
MADAARGTGRFPPVTAVCGRFGSGKTEVAINYALALARGARPYLIDLDIVTPYFRTRDKAHLLAQQGVTVIAPAEVAANLDTPGITPEILGAIQQTAQPVVLDVGGDKQGARALGQYGPYLRARGCEVWFVVNPFRPFTQDLAGIRLSIAEVEAGSRLQVTALVSNPNLMGETDADLVLRGHQVVEEASKALGLPIAFLAVERSLLPQFPNGRLPREVLPLTLYLRPPWGEPLSAPSPPTTPPSAGP